jgi:hypothetical protein
MKNKILQFRFHKGGLVDSMSTVTDIESMGHLITHIKHYWTIPFDGLTIEHYCWDERIAWDTYIVMAQVKDDRYPVGFLSGSPKEAWEPK